MCDNSFAGVEVPFDAVKVSYADLDMILVVKPGIRIKRLPFHEHASDRVISFFLLLFPEIVDGADHRAVEVAEKEFFGAHVGRILREISAGYCVKFQQVLITLAYRFDRLRFEQVQAETGVNNGADHRGGLDWCS